MNSASATRIFLVDDHDFLRRGLRAFFEREKNNAIVGEARNVEEALEHLQKTPADVVVMDLHLPGEDGIAGAAKIKARWPRTRVLVLSGKSSQPSGSGDVERAFLAGVDGFVSKQDGEDSLRPALDALRQGQNYLSPTPATELVRSLRAASTRNQEADALSDREKTVLQRLAEGASYKDIAAELDITVKSVDTYRTRLTRKIGLTSREDLIQHATRLGLIRSS